VAVNEESIQPFFRTLWDGCEKISRILFLATQPISLETLLNLPVRFLILFVEDEGVNDQERYRLYFGPYEPPRLPPGKMGRCHMRGRVRVGIWSNGNIPWPRRYRTNSLILCGDLVRAVRRESAQAVAWHWGVTLVTVFKWRKALKVPPVTAGTRRVREKWRTEFRQHHRYPEQIALRNVQVCRRYPRRRESPPTREAIRGLMERGLFAKPWTRKEEALLGTMSDAEAGRKVGRSVTAVKSRRNLLGIPIWKSAHAPWSAAQDKLLGTMSDADLAHRFQRTEAAVRGRRETLHIPKFDRLHRPWTKAELALLGTMPDAALAQKLGRTEKAVCSQRVTRRKLLRRVRPWRPEELRLLGTRPDREVARLVKRTVISVAGRRRWAGIPDVSGKSGGSPWTKAELALVGIKPDRVVANLTCRSLSSVRNRRWKLRSS